METRKWYNRKQEETNNNSLQSQLMLSNVCWMPSTCIHTHTHVRAHTSNVWNIPAIQSRNYASFRNWNAFISLTIVVEFLIYFRPNSRSHSRVNSSRIFAETHTSIHQHNQFRLSVCSYWATDGRRIQPSPIGTQGSTIARAMVKIDIFHYSEMK